MLLLLLWGILACSATKESGAGGVDADQDGYFSIESGGDDCDDQNAFVHPGADEVWYDGRDQDCSGGSDYDRDGDGEDSSAYGGLDCNDGDATIWSGAEEVEGDGVDNNCDGVAEEGTGSYTLAITEVMFHPLMVEGEAGQWIELFNYGSDPVDLEGVGIRNEAGQSRMLSGVVLSPNDWLVIGGAAEPENGGAAVDIVWSPGEFSIATSDRLVLFYNSVNIYVLQWGDADWPDVPGSAWGLDPSVSPLDATLGDWCPSTISYGLGDKGTPNTLNPSCITIDADGDGFKVEDGDCDDTNSLIHPGADEFLNQRDDDCNGMVDDLGIAEVSLVYLDGEDGDRIGKTVGLGDVSGDGVAEVMVGSPNDNGGEGSVLVADARTGGALSELHFAGLIGSSSNPALGAGTAGAADHDGDGVVDFLAAGGVLNSETIALTITPGGSMFFGDRPAGSGTLNLSGANGSSGQQLATQLDMDGDGISEILFGDPNPSSGTGSASLLFPALVSGVELNDPAWSLNVSGNSAGDLTGLGLGGGDLDGDGYDELLIGAPGTDTGASGSGVWALFSGAAPGAAVPLTEANALLTTSIAGAGMGFGRPIVADLDGSGAMDLAMGSFGANQVWFLSDPGLLSGVVDLDASAQILSGTGNFGFALSSGDTNLDGSLELIIGAPSVGGAAADPAWDSVPGVGTGMVWIVPGISLEGDVSGLAEASVFGAQEGDLFGSSLSVGADATGDAQDDLAIGAPRYGSGLSGRVWIYRGPPPE